MYLRVCVFFSCQCMKFSFYQILYNLSFLRTTLKKIPGAAATTSCKGNSKEESGSTGCFDQRETVDEELPLTFSYMVMVRIFSKKAKKICKKR